MRDRVDGDLGARPIAKVLEDLHREVVEKRIRQIVTGSAGLDDSKTKFQD